VAALAARPADPGTRPTGDTSSEGGLEKEYLRERIEEIRPLLKECYQLALEQRPALEGSLKVQFTVVADERLGGVIESSEIIAGSAQADPELRECVQESMYALRLKAPRNGGRVTVTYPFRFAQDPAGIAPSKGPP
jgi:hypothetical protein